MIQNIQKQVNYIQLISSFWAYAELNLHPFFYFLEKHIKKGFKATKHEKSFEERKRKFLFKALIAQKKMTGREKEKWLRGLRVRVMYLILIIRNIYTSIFNSIKPLWVEGPLWSYGLLWVVMNVLVTILKCLYKNV